MKTLFVRQELIPQMAGFGITGRQWEGIRRHALVSGSGNVVIRCLARDVSLTTPARRGRPCGEERSGRVARSGSQPWGAAYNGGDS